MTNRMGGRRILGALGLTCIAALAGCAMFDEDTRHPTNANGSPGTNGASTNDTKVAQDTTGDGGGGPSQSQGSTNPSATCTVTLPATTATGACGGAGGIETFPGSVESEPNDATATMLDATGAVACGSADGADQDRYSFVTDGTTCFHVSLVGTAGVVQISGAGVDGSVAFGDTTAFAPTSSGTVILTVKNAPAYKLVVR
jgi:hypothetical protein